MESITSPTNITVTQKADTVKRSLLDQVDNTVAHTKSFHRWKQNQQQNCRKKSILTLSDLFFFCMFGH